MLFGTGADAHSVWEYFGGAFLCDSDYCADRNEHLSKPYAKEKQFLQVCSLLRKK